MVKYITPSSTQETNNWNVAKSYSELLILKPLMLIREYEQIAMFGSSNLIEELFIDEQSKNRARLHAIKRLGKELKSLIDNSFFALKPSDQQKVEKIKERLNKIFELMPLLEIRNIDQRKNRTKISINEDIFLKCLDMLVDIKTDILKPLNDNNLIYGTYEEFDPDKEKERFMRDMVTTA